MKKIYLLLLLTTCPISGFCQPEINKDLDVADYYWQVSGVHEWAKYERQVFTYDGQGNNTESIGYYWDPLTGSWDQFWRRVYAYDSAGHMGESFSYYWDTITTDWVNQMHNIYSYDTSGNMIERLYWRLDPGNGNMVKYSRTIYISDSAGNEIEKIIYQWMGTPPDWSAQLRHISTYDTSSYLIQLDTYYWDSDSNHWQIAHRNVYTHDANGNKTEDISYNWDDVNNWTWYHRSVYIYDVNGYNTDFSGYLWDAADSTWKENYYGHKINDSSGKVLNEFRYTLDTENGDTISARYLTYLFDDNGNNIEEIEYRRQEPTTSVVNNPLTDNFILVFPNPIADRFTIRTSDNDQILNVDIFDTKGRIVRRIDHIENESITLTRDNLPSGLYFIRINADKIHVKKVIIR
jgi:hypothetical protein